MSSAILYELSRVPIVSYLYNHALSEDATWLSRTGVVFGGIVSAAIVAWFYMWPYREWRLAYKALDGPTPKEFFLGSLPEIIKRPPSAAHAEWIQSFGQTFRYRVFFGIWRFFTADVVALSYILGHADKFPKPSMTQKQMAEIVGNGVLVQEGDAHRRQRKILNPSFSQPAVRGMVPIFYDKAYELQEKLMTMILDPSIVSSPTPAVPEDVVPGARKIDVSRYLAQATLDVIGIAGFDYDFHSLASKEGEENELAEAYRTMFSATQEITITAILQAILPGGKYIPSKRKRVIAASKSITERIGTELVMKKKKQISATYADGLEKGDAIGKDLLSILIRANMASDLRPEQRLTDDEVIAQITTFMLAGNETSSTALTWCLYELALHPEVQDKLRKELQGVTEERPSVETLGGLPYLDAVIREILRYDGPVPNTIRSAGEDAVVPLGTPVRGKNGKMIDSIKLSKGDTIFLPIQSVNHNKDIWGPDADKFNPERHFTIPKEELNTVPGVWGNVLTFLGGARNCIGYKFALAEMKAILFVLLRNFSFEELPSKPVIERKTALVMRSKVATEKEAGLQMPLLVKPLAAA